MSLAWNMWKEKVWRALVTKVIPHKTYFITNKTWKFLCIIDPLKRLQCPLAYQGYKNYVSKVKVKITHSCQTLWVPCIQSMELSSQNTGVGSSSLLQGIFPTQGLNRGLSHCRQILYQLSYMEVYVSKATSQIIVNHVYYCSSSCPWHRLSHCSHCSHCLLNPG